VPYSIAFEGDVEDRLDGHYGGPSWRERLTPYMVSVSAVDTGRRDPVDERLARDPYGTIWRTDLRPSHLEEPALKEPSLERYEFPRVESFVSPGQKEEARRRCEEMKDSFLVGAVGWGLFERSWTIRGFENALMDAAAEPDFYEELLDRLVDLYAAFVDHTVDLPVDAIMFGDDWGDQRGVILGPERWRRLIKPRWAKLYERVHASGKLVISHCCGSVADIMPDIIEMGLDVLESVQPEARGMNPYDLKRDWGEKIVFWGGLGSQSTIPFGTPADIRREVGRLCREMGEGGGYILKPAKPLQPGTPTENAVAVIKAFIDQEQ
jgi:uroporphyrinogen decarboxylase